ncbi:hypothetical protein MHK_000383 [Candidatus Magnetomorum sp. HK-1]|nr:hypothetical protein MHK_000383 [Candidatus Magnetomorum sp. HK-1]
MIQIESKSDIYSQLKSEQIIKIEQIKKIIRLKIDMGQDLNKADFESYLNMEEIKDALWKAQCGKCCYCERERDTSELEIDHFRPISSVFEDDKHPGYWWMSYDWNNLFLICRSCKEQKKNKFPLLNDGIRAINPDDNLSDEKPFMINPADENPEDYIGFDWDSTKLCVKAVGLDKDGRGQKTIYELTAINNTFVIEERAKQLDDLNSIADLCKIAELKNSMPELIRCVKIIISFTKKTHQFSSFYKSFFKKNNLDKYIDSNVEKEFCDENHTQSSIKNEGVIMINNSIIQNSKIAYGENIDQSNLDYANDGLITELNKLNYELAKLDIEKNNRDAIDVQVENLKNYAKLDNKNSVLMKSTLEAIKNITQGALGSAMGAGLIEAFKRVGMMIV